jgi:hypothetical protein
MSEYGEAEQVAFLIGVVKEARKALNKDKDCEAYRILTKILEKHGETK